MDEDEMQTTRDGLLEALGLIKGFRERVKVGMAEWVSRERLVPYGGWLDSADEVIAEIELAVEDLRQD